MEVKKILMPNTKYSIKSPYTMEAELYVVHNTANDASAFNEITYMITNTNQISFHYAIDDIEIVQGIPENRNSWNAGDGSNGKGNRKGIAIEICYSKSGGDRFDKAEERAAQFIAQGLIDKGWGIDKVKKHQDFSGKYCPHRTLDRGWDRFLNMIKSHMVGMPIVSAPTATIAQMKAWAKSKNANQLLIDLAETYYNVSVNIGINPIVTYCQSAKETGYMKFGGVLDASFKNPCGLKTTAGGSNTSPSAHKKFNSWEEGIQAQVDHLALYAGVNGYPKADTPDPRHFPYLHGKAPTVEALGGKWAPSVEYGNSIIRMVKEVEGMFVEEPIEVPTELVDIRLSLHGKPLTVKGIFKDGVNYIPIRFIENMGYKLDGKGNELNIEYKSEALG